MALQKSPLFPSVVSFFHPSFFPFSSFSTSVLSCAPSIVFCLSDMHTPTAATTRTPAHTRFFIVEEEKQKKKDKRTSLPS
jgi:hypothetical protein